MLDMMLNMMLNITLHLTSCLTSYLALYVVFYLIYGKGNAKCNINFKTIYSRLFNVVLFYKDIHDIRMGLYILSKYFYRVVDKRR